MKAPTLGMPTLGTAIFLSLHQLSSDPTRGADAMPPNPGTSGRVYVIPAVLAFAVIAVALLHLRSQPKEDKVILADFLTPLKKHVPGMPLLPVLEEGNNAHAVRSASIILP
jgi:hypothetical protein